MARPLSIALEIDANELRRRISLGDTAPVDTRKALQQLGVFVRADAHARVFFWDVLEVQRQKIHARKFKGCSWPSTFYYCT